MEILKLQKKNLFFVSKKKFRYNIQENEIIYKTTKGKKIIRLSNSSGTKLI